MSLETRIDAALHAAIEHTQISSAPRQLSQALKHALFPGGARVRPQLCLSVAQACGGDQPELADAAATAIELIHCGSLVHDDMPCFDDSDLRRGKPSVHKAFGEPIALLTGDALIVLAFEVLAKAAVHDPLRAANLSGLMARFTGSPYGICAGLAAGADPEPWQELGSRIGEAFQVADDLRDVLYDEETLGKPVGQDAVHGRPNAVAMYGTQAAVKRLNDILGGAISSIPSCPGEARLCGIVQAQAERLAPTRTQPIPAE